MFCEWSESVKELCTFCSPVSCVIQLSEHLPSYGKEQWNVLVCLLAENTHKHIFQIKSYSQKRDKANGMCQLWVVRSGKSVFAQQIALGEIAGTERVVVSFALGNSCIPVLACERVYGFSQILAEVTVGRTAVVVFKLEIDHLGRGLCCTQSPCSHWGGSAGLNSKRAVPQLPHQCHR